MLWDQNNLLEEKKNIKLCLLVKPTAICGNRVGDTCSLCIHICGNRMGNTYLFCLHLPMSIRIILYQHVLKDPYTKYKPSLV